MEKLQKILAWKLTKIRNKKEVINETRKEGRTVHFAPLMDICHHKNSELEPKISKIEKNELYSEVTLWKMIWALMQYSKSKVHLRHKWRPQRSWIRVDGTWCTAVAGAGWCCTPYTAVGSPLDEWKLLSCLRGYHCNKLLKNGWIEAAPSGRLRCADAYATFSWLQLTDLPIQLRLVRDFLLSLLPVLRHFTSQFFRSPLWLPFAEIAPTSLALCQRVRQTLQSDIFSLFSCSGNEAFRLCSISASSSCQFSTRRCFVVRMSLVISICRISNLSWVL